MINKIIQSNSLNDDYETGSSSLSPQLIDTLEFSEIDHFPDFGSIDHGQLFTLSLRTKTTDFMDCIDSQLNLSPKFRTGLLSNFQVQTVMYLIPSWDLGQP
jgi:hypothetical protein